MKQSLFATLILLGMFSQNLAAEAVNVGIHVTLKGLSGSVERYQKRLENARTRLVELGEMGAAKKIARELVKVNKHQAVLRKVEETVAGSK